MNHRFATLILLLIGTLPGCTATPNDPSTAALREMGAVKLAEGAAIAGTDRRAAAVWELGDIYLYQLADDRLITAWLDEHSGQLIQTPWAQEPGFIERVAYAPLPASPAGLAVREVARLPHQGVRLLPTEDGKGLHVLGRRGDLWRVALRDGRVTTLLTREAYVEPYADVLGFARDPQGRFFIVANQKDDSVTPWLNRVTIFRTNPLNPEQPLRPEPWFRTRYPYGINQFNHGVAHLAFGPDGMLYACSGSRTDADEDGDLPHIATGGETPLTACLWQLDPNDQRPTPRVFADGLRNPFGFAWDGRGRMFATESGPNRDAPEELNLIEAGRHYGYPYRFSTLDSNPYKHLRQRAVPADLAFTDPIPNLGPDGGGSPDQPRHTFDDHSSPVGITFVGDKLPEPYADSFLVTRYGNQVDIGTSVGFDLLRVKIIEQPDGSLAAQTHRVIGGLARPIDVAVVDGRIYVLEFGRGTDHRDWVQQVLPGRILELTLTDP